jgi:plasmid stabilization system protein ParE
MSKPVKKSGRAIIDTDEQADYIARHNMDAADRYLDAVELAVLSLGVRPNRGSNHFIAPRMRNSKASDA